MYECRATNGVDPPVSKKVKFTPLDGKHSRFEKRMSSRRCVLEKLFIFIFEKLLTLKVIVYARDPSLFSVLAHKLPADYPKKVDNPKQEKYPEKVFYGSNLTFYCDATGGTNLDYQWYYNRVPLGKIDAKQSRAVGLDYKLSTDHRVLNIYNIPVIL